MLITTTERAFVLLFLDMFSIVPRRLLSMYEKKEKIGENEVLWIIFRKVF